MGYWSRQTFAAAMSLWLWTAACSLHAKRASEFSPSASDLVITNMTQFWGLPADEKNRQQLARLELIIYFCDTNWNVYWGQSDGLNTFLPFHGLSKPLHSGEKVLINGPVLPVSQQFVWDKTSISVLSESNQITAVSAAGKILDAAALRFQVVEVEALVDSVDTASPSILTMNLLVDGCPIVAYVHRNAAVGGNADWDGKKIRIRGLYAATSDSSGKTANIVLWSPGMDQIQVIGSLDNDPRFSIPLISSEDLSSAGPTNLVRVVGVVRGQKPSASVTIWDDSGQIKIFTTQRQPLQLGDHIEAIGYPECQGYDRTLQNGLFRVAVNWAAPGNTVPTNAPKLRLAEQVRGLDQETIALRPTVNLQGEVTWADAHRQCFFVQDSSGGVRVMQTRLHSGRRIQPGMLVDVDGVAASGEFAPVITNAVVRQLGTLEMPGAPLISFEEALTGTEDGDWIQMRGYVRKATQSNGELVLQLVTPSGEFVARVPRADADQAPPGSIVLVRGVCTAEANSRRQLTGIEILSKVPGSVQTEQLAPADIFALPRRSIASLRQFNLVNALNKRVRTSGTVTLQVPGHFLYLQDGDNSLFALSDQTERLKPGDQVDIVGFPGDEDGNFLLREAMYRRLSSGIEPAPVRLPPSPVANEDLDGLLVRAGGMLLNLIAKPTETRLVLQVNDRVFEARLDGHDSLTNVSLLPGSQVAVTGVYRIQRDENGKPASFLLNLRNSNDVQLLAPPPWWTLRRLSFILAGVLPVFILAVLWAWQTRRKNLQLQSAQIELTTAQAKLEERVKERTRELNEESEARNRALVRLSEAQQRLIVASRQAGMAEVATGVLHNVGNTLNSVNVSASMIGDSLQRLRIEKFCKAVELLAEQKDNLAAFLTNDPRGRALPGYLQQLAANMAQNERTLETEVKSLTKQIDHVKAVVTWQQGHARSSGFYESLDLEELMEDALQINYEAYERHGIEVVRQFDDDVPSVISDRHKILQILINFLSNARQALMASQTVSRWVVLRIRLHGENRVRMEVSDNGVGIPAENLERIFSLGFTTKPNGHGFGLHSGANSAREMGGNLFAMSDGPDRGSTFILELPLAPPAQTPANSGLQPVVKLMK